MPSFDIVSQLNRQEVDNAVNQAKKEVSTRYDFRGSRCQIELDKDSIRLLADDEFKMKALIYILQSKIIKRGLSLKAFQFGKIESGPDGLTKCPVTLVNGIETEKAKELVKAVKETKLKIQASIQGDLVRVSGKSRDDLQQAIQTVRALNFPLPLQFINFRD